MPLLTRRRLQFAAASTAIQLFWGTASTAQDLDARQRAVAGRVWANAHLVPEVCPGSPSPRCGAGFSWGQTDLVVGVPERRRG